MAHKGFTLIEILLYIGMVTIILVTSAGFSFTILATENHHTATTEMDAQAARIFDQVASTIRQASSITSPAPSTTATNLELQMPDNNSNPTIFYADQGVLYIHRGSHPPTAITSSRIIVNSLTFSNLGSTTGPGAIHTELSLKRTANPTDLSGELLRFYETTSTIRR